MQNSHSELVWQGRIHLGDEPGIIGDASYSGLAAELPVTLIKYLEQDVPDDICIVIEASGVKLFEGYDGHIVSVSGYKSMTPDDARSKWEEVAVASERLRHDFLLVSMDPQRTRNLRFFSVCVRIDTSVTAGLYDDFLLLGLSLRSTTHYASFGFH